MSEQGRSCEGVLNKHVDVLFADSRQLLGPLPRAAPRGCPPTSMCMYTPFSHPISRRVLDSLVPALLVGSTGGFCSFAPEEKYVLKLEFHKVSVTLSLLVLRLFSASFQFPVVP